jgi:hypothetical protein
MRKANRSLILLVSGPVQLMEADLPAVGRCQSWHVVESQDLRAAGCKVCVVLSDAVDLTTGLAGGGQCHC